MTRISTRAAAAIVALAIAAAPTLLDQCAETCAAHPASVASTPACHHATPTGLRIGRVPQQCGHDHGGAALTVIKNAAPKPTSTALIAVADDVRAVTPSSSDDRWLPDQAPPGSSLVLHAYSLPLRI